MSHEPTPEVTPDVTPYAWTWTNEAADVFGHTLNIRETEILHGPGARRGRRIASVVSDNISEAVLIAKAPEMKLDLVMICERIESWLLQVNGPEHASIRQDMRQELATMRVLLRAIERERP